MAFTAGELSSIANAALDFYMDRPKIYYQTIQNKPLLASMEKSKKTFPGGKGDISVAVKGAFGAGGTNDGVTGYTHNDTVNFYTPENIERAAYAWREMHIGITLTHTELKIDGISVVDTNGDKMSKHSRRELTVLANLMEDKMADLNERRAVSMNALLWGDGVADAKALAGIQHIIAANPTTGTVGGINRATAGNEWWRNRARTAAHAGAGGTGAVTSSVANGGALLQVLQQEYRQLVRYGGRPTLALCGSDFIDAMETELRANGLYTNSGYTDSNVDAALPELKFHGQRFKYDPTLDDLSLPKRCYWIDTDAICLMAMQDEWGKKHTPARPSDQFLLYKSLTYTGQMVARQCNSSLVIDIV